MSKNNKKEIGKHLDDIKIGVDFTDHIAFICPDCGSVLKVEKVFTIKVNVTEDGLRDRCTYIKLSCNNCGGFGQRKFYWKTEDGKFCNKLTGEKE